MPRSRVWKHDLPGGGVVYSASTFDGRLVRLVVPTGAWRSYAASREEWICSYAGFVPQRGMY